MRHGAPQVDRAGSPHRAGALSAAELQAIWDHLQQQARTLGFSQIGVADVDLSTAEPGFLAWLKAGFAGEMRYMAGHGLKRLRPAELVPGTVRVITARMDYLPPLAPGDQAAQRRGAPQAESPCDPRPEDDADSPAWQLIEWARLQQPTQATVSLYARGRDYHRVLRPRLAQLAESLQARIGPFGHRAFTDSAPVAEVELAQRSGLGWRGKHTLLLHREAGSMFFLGELFVDIPLALTPPVSPHCGQCSACLSICPTQAIVAPYRLDARRCISYLTIEHSGPIDTALRPLMGNRIYGCDDCQLVCPWNKYAQRATVPDFAPRSVWQQADLLGLWAWSEADFLRHTEGSAIRRIGYERWRRNLAVALGNALAGRPGLTPSALLKDGDPTWRQAALNALQAAREGASALVRDHIDWALSQGPGAGGIG